ncbi:UDP-N-acetylmuramoyl-L-alanine--D-glutamate ligase [Sabulicella glaciei]|uniref:UDP-N-acetylmuramoylalanine--D-glutamate ligase n=1 Tax=Sabulicella glaciei TaxID=2984948 RepID=A0ABT3NXP7_9PROT|nr:UDP-N-acetylmuramoyl-L-alanine--D-glutamate ligase [Roseococcus sp. MDT2-1-1]MCW8086943.1 UDP-N-acetylmuramoyl-L-alanine--D-glutamate ligase [Roseococcus sp. MDT2-1-1]
MMPFAGQRVAVVGLGKAGLPAARRLTQWGAEVTAWDDREEARDEARRAGLPVADPAERFSFDVLLLSPGIPHRLPRPHRAAEAAREAGAPILSEIEFLFRAVRHAGSRARFAGITGTNGKSTTTALLAHLLERAGREVAAGGNLGPPALDMPILGDDGVYVLEMSSYALERLDRTRFDVAAVLNLSPDHLDRHGDMAGYRAAKARIFAHHGQDDVAVLGQGDALTASLAAEIPSRIVPLGPGGVWWEGRILRDAAGPIADLAGCPSLPGDHNAQNAAAACAMAMALGLPRDALAEGLRSYPGLPHRQEIVAERDGILFVNDSKATNADSAEKALASYGRIVWIAGGTGKEGGIAPLAPLFGRIAHALLIGRDGPEFASTLASHGIAHEVAGTLEAAVPRAMALAQRGDVVLLSPAAASWDQFTGFDARGDRFRQLVREALG